MQWTLVIVPLLSRCRSTNISVTDALRQSHDTVAVQWAHNQTEYDRHSTEVRRRLGIQPELVVADGIRQRWNVMRDIILDMRADSILDVGGIGTYANMGLRYRCVNIRRSRPPCVQYHGSKLPYSNGSFDVVLAETVLHHAASNATELLREMNRVSARYVIVSEDILERGASEDVVKAYRRHDKNAVYRTLNEWLRLAAESRLDLSRLLWLHRVPLHVWHEARGLCQLGFAPMVYMIWETHLALHRNDSAWHAHQPQSSYAKLVEWHKWRNQEEEAAGIQSWPLRHYQAAERHRKRASALDRFFVRLLEPLWTRVLICIFGIPVMCSLLNAVADTLAETILLVDEILGSPLMKSVQSRTRTRRRSSNHGRVRYRFLSMPRA